VVSSTDLAAYLKRHFAAVLMVALLLGLVLPGVSQTPEWLMLALLAGTIFVSCFQVSAVGFANTPWLVCGLFYLCRFIVLPVGLYALVAPFSTVFAAGLLLYALMPAGVSAPGVTHICGGNVAASWVLLMASSLLAPVVVPAVMAAMTGKAALIDPQDLFATLLVTLFLPLLLHVPFRRSKPVVDGVAAYGSLIVVSLIVALVVLVVGGSRDALFAALQVLPAYLLIAAGVFALFYGLGWWFFARGSQEDRIALMLSSGSNNSMMAVVLASLYLDDALNTLFIVALVCWVVMMSVASKWLAVSERKLLGS